MIRERVVKIKRCRAQVAWDIRERSASLWKALSTERPWLKSLHAGFSQWLPIAKSCATFKSGPYIRPQGHNRAFYILRPPHGVVAIKGGEPLSEDLPSKLNQLRDGYGILKDSPLEYLPTVEQKVPMGLLLEEALEEAERAAEFQSAYWKMYGEPARIPLPLLVCRLPEEAAARIGAALLPLISERSARLAQTLLAGGLGVLIYHYPRLPVRVLHLAGVAESSEAGGYRHRAERLRIFGSLFGEPPKLSETVSRWIRLAARMMGLGFFPCRLSGRYAGHCLQEQNAVIDGGFVDVDSLQPMAAVPDERAFYETFLMAWLDLSATVRRFLVGYADRSDLSWPSAALSHSYLAIPMLVGCHIGRRLGEDLAEEIQRGLRPDPRLVRALGSWDRFSRLDRALDSLIPGSRPKKITQDDRFLHDDPHPTLPLKGEGLE